MAIDIKQRLANLAERRGETPEGRAMLAAAEQETDAEWTERQRLGVPLTPTSPSAQLVLEAERKRALATDGVVGEENTPAAVAKLLEGSGDDDEILALMGALEDYQRLRAEYYNITHPMLSLEGFGDTLKEILDKLIEWCRRLFAKFTENMVASKLVLDNIMDRHMELYEQARRENRKSTSPTFQVKTRLGNLIVRGRPVSDSLGLLVASRNLRDVVKSYYTTIDRSTSAAAAGITRLVAADAPRDAIAQLLLQAAPTSLYGQRGWRNDQDGTSSVPLLGNRYIKVEYGPVDDPFEGVRSIRIAMEESRTTHYVIPEVIEYTRFSMPTHDQLMNTIRETGEILEQSVGTLFSNERHQRLEAMRGCMQKIRNRLDHEHQHTEDDYRQMVSLIETYVGWLTSPYLELFTLTCRNMKALLNVCEGNIT
jgi:hypothetical protein